MLLGKFIAHTTKMMTENFYFSKGKTRLKKFSPRPRGKTLIGKILFEYAIQVAKFSLQNNLY